MVANAGSRGKIQLRWNHGRLASASSQRQIGLPLIDATNPWGHGYLLPGKLLKEEFNRGGLVQRLLLRYTQALVTQMFQTAACNRHHSIEQQLCRWLLLTLDRMPTNELVMTQELVASTLGVRREGVTEAAGNLQRAGFISYRRGHISVLKRAGLETNACECYAVVKKEIARLLSDVQYRQGTSAVAV